MRRYIIIWLVSFLSLSLQSQTVRFKFEVISSDLAFLPKDSVEGTISKLLTEINRADRMNSSLNLYGINMEENAKIKLRKFWSNMHFSCEDIENIQKCLQDAQGYQIRNIPVTLHPLDDTYHGSLVKTIVISLNKKGQISGVRTALDRQDYKKVMETGKVISDELQRREILRLIEDYRGYYFEKDINNIRKFFLGGSSSIVGTTNNTYSKEEIDEKLVLLQQLFINDFVIPSFSDIKISRNLSVGRENFYGVTFKQKLEANECSEEGYVFLLWEFKDNGEPPVIHVRAWQPDKYPDGSPMKEDDILDMHYFYIP